MMHSAIQGYYYDRLINVKGVTRWSSGWRSNRILYRSSLLLAALMKREPDTAGILYWAVGDGESGWDASMPSPKAGDRSLTHETHRFQLNEDQIQFADGLGRPTTSPTNRLQISLTIHGAELVAEGFVSLREFALYGGRATESSNSGTIVNRVIHPRIDIGVTDTLQRTVQLTFQAEAAQPPSIPGFPGVPRPSFTLSLADSDTSGLAMAAPRSIERTVETSLPGQPVSIIDGIGAQYTQAFAAGGVHTITDLAQINAQRSFSGIPPARVRELRAKALLLTGIQIDLAEWSPWSSLTMADLLSKTADVLVQTNYFPGLTVSAVQALQMEIEILYVTVAHAQLQSIRLADLMSE